MARVDVVIASIRDLTNIKYLDFDRTKNEIKVLVVDEGDRRLRKKNDEVLSELSHEYYGPYEREEWFKQRFGSRCSKYLSVIPRRCHAETSFGFLIAYEEKPDFIIQLDDDVYPLQGHEVGMISGHASNLFNDDGITVHSRSKWFNTLEILKLNSKHEVFPRGHPYAQDARGGEHNWSENGAKCVLNMGLWAGCPDLDALTLLYHGGLDGTCDIKGEKLEKKKVVVANGTYFALCSMNTSFLPEIIPAFYQMYMNFMGVDRFDDIWAGVFLKKVADHLDVGLCLGEPLAYHEKMRRSIFKDLEKEVAGLFLNEVLWRIVDSLEIVGENYWDAYNSLIYGLEKSIIDAKLDSFHRKFLEEQVKKAKLWLEITDHIN